MTHFFSRAAGHPAGRPARFLVAALSATLLAAVAITAQAQPGPGMGPGPRHGMHDGGGMLFGGSPERMGRMIDRMLDGLNATDAQRAKIKQIVAAAATDVRADGRAGRELRQRGMQLFTAPTVDAAAAEQLRQQQLQQQDRTSRRVTQAMVEAANVLTPEQRARIGERMRERQSRMDERSKRMERDRPAR